jgi:hypothetical protein
MYMIFGAEAGWGGGGAGEAANGKQNLLVWVIKSNLPLFIHTQVRLLLCLTTENDIAAL